VSARVLVAMSGGVDSSVAAALLRERGCDVVGVAMRLAPEADGWAPREALNKSTSAGRDARPTSRLKAFSEVGRAFLPARRPVRRGTCCSYEDFEDARRVAERMDFPFYVVDLRAEFAARVVDRFVSGYLEGTTPNPCVMCNREIKFDRLWQRAKALSADFIATGHYARVERGPDGRLRLLRAVDSSKDQSYFLFALAQAELSRVMFPLGTMTKADVRARARALGLANADKAESQEICFVPDGDYARTVERMADPALIRRGRIVDGAGGVLGEHSGIHRFTIGQRRGLGVAIGEPLYVKAISRGTGDVTVGRREELSARGLIAERVSLVDPRAVQHAPAPVEVKIRYRHQAVPAMLTMTAAGRAEVRFTSSDRAPAVTPGQACVFYRGEEVLGGGFIERAMAG
jgi:tRNA-uridine 2-sulfurtransferase